MKKRILSLLLCLVMVVSLLPVTAHASEEHECWYCGAIYYGDNVPDELYRDCCGICAPETYRDCWFDSHCLECGACYQFVNKWCTDCTRCVDCMEDQPETHCSACGDCYVGQEDELCGNCYRCDTCATLCESCGFCDECAVDVDDPLHCIICDACFTEVEPANHDGSSAKHCVECCTYCEQCADWETTCMTDDTIGVYCDECGLCEKCCMANRESAGGCELYCIESSEYEEHVCGECGECWCEKEQCPDCGLCEDCCAEASDCKGSSTKMCVEDSDYDDHFCPECREHCICEDNFCEDCGLCEDCCEDAYNDVINDASFILCEECVYACVEGGDFAAHIEDKHSGYTHSHTCVWKKAYDMNQYNHWHECAFKNCDEKNAVVPHTFTDDICYECGYSKGAKVYFTTQPSDAHVQVSDVNDYDYVDYPGGTIEYGPTHHWYNRTTFRAKAFGKNLTYQWYEAYGSAEGKALVNNTTGIVYSSDKYISGANTPNLTISVDSEACTANLVYYCVVTDGEDTATSEHAKMIATHRFNKAKADTTDKGGKNIYFQDTTEADDYRREFVPASTGHRWYCCGDGHTSDELTRDRAAKPHNFGEGYVNTVMAAYTATAAADGNFIQLEVWECADCGYKKYVQEHEHRMRAEALDEDDKDVGKKHKLVCDTVPGCEETGSAPHNWAFSVMSVPTEEADGTVKRQCLECGYTEENFVWKTKEAGDSEYTEKHLNTGNMLINVDEGSANISLAEPGNTIVLTPKLDGVHKLTGWTANYNYGEDTPKPITMTIERQENGTWKCTIPEDFFAANDVKGGGELFFMPQKSEDACAHEHTQEGVGAYDSVCKKKGYTGDKVCQDCGFVVEKGTAISGGAEHTGTLTLKPNTTVEATCTKRGYEGDFVCSVCGGIEYGKRTSYAHTNKTTEGYVAPTCTEKGYSGNIACEDCGVVLAAGRETASLGGHDWDDGTIKTGGRGKLVRKTVTYACKRDGCDATKTVPLLSSIIDGDKITAANFNMSGYVMNGSISDFTVTADAATAEKVNIIRTMLLDRNPVDKTTGNIDVSGAPLTGEFVAGKTYYLVVGMEPKEDLEFSVAMKAGHVTLNEKEPAQLLVDETLKIGSSSTAVELTAKVAVFKLKAFSKPIITFDGNGGLGTMEYARANQDGTYVLPACGFTAQDHKEFDRWQIGDVSKAVGETITVTEDTTVTALWKDKLYTVTVNGAGSGASGAGSYIKDSTVTLYAGTKHGYTFNGWTSNEMTIPEPGKLNTSFTMPGCDVTVTANWIVTPASGGSSGAGRPYRPGLSTAVPEGTTGTAADSTTTVLSPGTGDAGIVLYAALSLMSMTGGAWLVSKKRRDR